MRRNGTTWLNNPDRFHSSIMHQDSGDKRASWMRRIRLIWTELVLQAFATQSEWGLVVGIVGVYMPSCVRAETACLGMTRAWRTHACIQMWLVHRICYFVEKHEMHTCAIQVILINALTRAGRLQITNAVFSASPTFYMCTLELPKAVVKQIDKFRKLPLKWLKYQWWNIAQSCLGNDMCPKRGRRIGCHQYWNTESISIDEKPGQVLQQEKHPLGSIWFGRSTTKMENCRAMSRDLFGGEMCWCCSQNSKTWHLFKLKMGKLACFGKIDG